MLNKRNFITVFVIIAVVVIAGFATGRLQVIGRTDSGESFNMDFNSSSAGGWVAVRLDAFGAWCNIQVSYKDLGKFDTEGEGKEEEKSEYLLDRPGLIDQ